MQSKMIEKTWSVFKSSWKLSLFISYYDAYKHLYFRVGAFQLEEFEVSFGFMGSSVAITLYKEYSQPNLSSRSLNDWDEITEEEPVFYLED